MDNVVLSKPKLGFSEVVSDPISPFSLFSSKFKIILTTSLYLAGMHPSLDD
jgi:hypothetical protein